jgi:hypothetical protein
MGILKCALIASKKSLSTHSVWFHFASDVTVSGTVIVNLDNSLVAELQVAGSGTKGDTLHIEGCFLPRGHRAFGQFKVTGALGGCKVAVLVPEG